MMDHNLRPVAARLESTACGRTPSESDELHARWAVEAGVEICPRCLMPVEFVPRAIGNGAKGVGARRIVCAVTRELKRRERAERKAGRKAR